MRFKGSHIVQKSVDEERIAALQAEVERRVGVEAQLHDLAEGFLKRAEAAEAKAEARWKALKKIDELEPLELNPRNYDHDDVCELNDNAVQAANIARAALAAGEAQPSTLGDAPTDVVGWTAAGDRAEVEREVVDLAAENEKLRIVIWLRSLPPYAENSDYFADAIERGDHRKKPMDLETARDATWP